jgi:hypothetical protein
VAVGGSWSTEDPKYVDGSGKKKKENREAKSVALEATRLPGASSFDGGERETAMEGIISNRLFLGTAT